MSEIVNESLQKVAKGTGIVFLGTIIGLLLAFASKVIVIRYITQSEYGILSLASVLASFFIVISTLGLQAGSTRQIAYYRGKNDILKVRSVVFSAMQMAVTASVLLSLVLFFTSNLISTNIFHSPELATPLKIYSLVIPFTALINIFTSIFRGFDRVGPMVYFENILRNALLPLLLIIVILFGLPFLGVVSVHVAATILSGIAFAIYTMKKSPLPIRVTMGEASAIATPMRKELLFFSLPLLVTAVIGLILGWTDTLMLGYFKTPDVVGLYNAASPLAVFVSSLTLGSMLFIYVPIASQLYSKGLTEELRRNYTVLTKWTTSAGMPLFLIFLLFPEAVLNSFFGANYVPAGIVLRILAIGFLIDNLSGPNGATLMVIGKTRFLMWVALAGAGTNVILNLVLIPPIGIVGASIASLIAIALVNIIRAVKLYSLTKAQPLSKNLLKPMVTSTGLISLIYILTKGVVITLWMLPLLFILFLGIYGLSILLTKSFDREDTRMLLAIEERLGLNLTLIKGFLKRFI